MHEPRDLVTFYAKDPALAELPRAWRDERDPGEVPSGADPVVFSFRRLTRKQRRTIYHGGTDDERAEYAFLCGIRRVQGGRFGSLGWQRPDDDKIHLDEDLAEELFTPDELVDVGAYILRASMLGKGFDGPWPPSPTSPREPDAPALPSAESSQG